MHFAQTTGEPIICEPAFATITTKTDYDHLKQMIDEEGRKAAQRYHTPANNDGTQSNPQALHSPEEPSSRKRAADTAATTASDEEPYPPTYNTPSSPSPYPEKTYCRDREMPKPQEPSLGHSSSLGGNASKELFPNGPRHAKELQ